MSMVKECDVIGRELARIGALMEQVKPYGPRLDEARAVNLLALTLTARREALAAAVKAEAIYTDRDNATLPWTVVGLWQNAETDIDALFIEHYDADSAQAAAEMAPDGVDVLAVFPGHLTAHEPKPKEMKGGA